MPLDGDTHGGTRADFGYPRQSVSDEVDRYILTGESDVLYLAWPGNGVVERASRAHDDLRGALVRVVRQRTAGLTHSPIAQLDTVAFTREKTEPMVRGLFPRAEQELVLAVLARSVVFLTSANIKGILQGPGFHSTAWDLANLYLGSLGVDLLSEDAPALVGLSQETTCYVSSEYFTQDDPFADFVVHEVSHIFHNSKRASLGLPSSRSKEWLLDIEYAKRETFAYSCEAFSRVVEGAKTLAARRKLAEEYGHWASMSDERVDRQRWQVLSRRRRQFATVGRSYSHGAHRRDAHECDVHAPGIVHYCYLFTYRVQ